MQPVSPRLAIDYGAACTQAVLGGPDGSWMPLPLDGSRLDMSSSAHIGADGVVVVGEEAWRRAAHDPQGFVLSPLALRAAGTLEVSVAGRQVDTADLAAATLRHVAGRAAKLSGGLIEDVRLVVPAGFGPKRHMWLRQAAGRAGLGVPRLIPAPVAAGQRLLAATEVQVQVPVGSFLLIADLGAGAEMSVLRRGPHGLEILATIADPAAGAASADERLLQSLASPVGAPADGSATGTPADGGRWVRLASARTAREQLSQQVTVVVAMPGGPPAVLPAQVAEQATAAVWAAAGELAARTIGAAELTVEQLAGIYLIGGAASTPAAVAAVGSRLGAAPQQIQQPAFTAVLGAVDADNRPAASAPPAGTGRPVAHDWSPQLPGRLPPLRRLVAMVLPGVAALAMWIHMIVTTDYEDGSPQYPGLRYHVWAAWGELAVVGVLIVLTCLASAGVLATVLTARRPRDPADAGPVVLAAAAGLAVCGLLGLLTNAIYNVPSPGPQLRWALLPALPVVVTALALAALAHRRGRPPLIGWDAFFTFPLSALILLGVGFPLRSYLYTTAVPTWYTPLAYTGAAMIGVGLACVLFRHLALRAVAGLFLGVFGFVVSNPNTLGIVVAVAVTVRLAYQIRFLYTAPAASQNAALAPVSWQ